MKQGRVFVLISLSIILLLSSCGEASDPVVEINAPANGTIYSPLDTIQLLATVTHDINVSTITTLIEPVFVTGEFDVGFLADRQNIEFSSSVPVNLTKGFYTFVLTATDGVGGEGSDSFNFTVD